MSRVKSCQGTHVSKSMVWNSKVCWICKLWSSKANQYSFLGSQLFSLNYNYEVNVSSHVRIYMYDLICNLLIYSYTRLNAKLHDYSLLLQGAVKEQASEDPRLDVQRFGKLASVEAQKEQHLCSQWCSVLWAWKYQQFVSTLGLHTCNYFE